VRSNLRVRENPAKVGVAPARPRSEWRQADQTVFRRRPYRLTKALSLNLKNKGRNSFMSMSKAMREGWLAAWQSSKADLGMSPALSVAANVLGHDRSWDECERLYG
jgi:hypothetical protein